MTRRKAGSCVTQGCFLLSVLDFVKGSAWPIHFPLPLSTRGRTQVWAAWASNLKSPPAVALAALVTMAKSAAMDMMGNLDIFLNSNEIFIPELKISVSLQNSSDPGGSQPQRVTELFH